MSAGFNPSTVPLEFVTWIGCFAVCRLIQRSLCRRYPALRSVCRAGFLATLVVAILPAAWTVATGAHGAMLLAQVTHVFGMGVLAQTSLRSLLLAGWLAWTGPHPAVAVGLPAMGSHSEAELLAMLVALTAVLRPKREPEKESS